MFCRKCGKEVSDEAVVCIHCGCTVNESNAGNKSSVSHSADMDTPKTLIGVLCGWFLGILGVLVGLLAYKEGTIARKSFMKAWGITIGISMVISIVVSIVAYKYMFDMIYSIMGSTMDSFMIY